LKSWKFRIRLPLKAKGQLNRFSGSKEAASCALRCKFAGKQAIWEGSSVPDQQFIFIILIVYIMLAWEASVTKRSCTFCPPPASHDPDGHNDLLQFLFPFLYNQTINFKIGSILVVQYCTKLAVSIHQ
jgi:hypothetical protein